MPCYVAESTESEYRWDQWLFCIDPKFMQSHAPLCNLVKVSSISIKIIQINFPLHAAYFDANKNYFLTLIYIYDIHDFTLI